VPNPRNSPPDPHASLLAVRQELAKAVVGQDAVISGLLIALLSGGHVLIEGVPGVAKTLMVKALAAALDADFARIQFTPDLMPSDVTGQVVYAGQGTDFHFRPGPVFTNLLLADEVNRTPAKTQAALLEAMGERQVTVEGQRRPLPTPFLVVATQNPVEYEGTYPLPEAQLDRFLLKLTIGYPSADQELEMANRHALGQDPTDIAATGITAVANPAVLEAARLAAAAVRIEEPVLRYIVSLCRATRETPALSLGVSPRGVTMLVRTAQAWAWMQGRAFVTPDEVKTMALPTLRHRVQVRPEAELDGVTADSALGAVLASVPVPR
jgi:MoxR-like ATPase